MCLPTHVLRGRCGTGHLSQGSCFQAPCLVPTVHLHRLLPTWEQRQMAQMVEGMPGLGPGWVPSALHCDSLGVNFRETSTLCLDALMPPP
jgi:hypothetical protein